MYLETVAQNQNYCILFSVALFIVVTQGSQNPYCSLSCNFGEQTFVHTVCNREEQKCGPAEKCGSDFRVIDMTNEWRQFVLDLHNRLRNQVAAGNETRNEQPSAANMNVLVYDLELEFLAQCWANDCNGRPLLHDKCRSSRKDSHVGQNLGFINSSVADINFKASMEELIMHWYNEVEIFKSEWVNYTDDRGPDIKVGHYTQIIWGDTTSVGCASTYYTSVDNNVTWHHFLFACNYAPGGNYLTLPTYKIGDPCTGCGPPNEECNWDYEALCGKTVPVNESLNLDVDFLSLFDFD